MTTCCPSRDGLLPADNSRVGFRPHWDAWAPSFTLWLALVLPGLLALAGCAPSALGSVRGKLAAGQYAAAHQELLALQATPQELNASQRTEVKDGLCLTEFMIGTPTYTLSEQRRICAGAASEPGSQSAQFVRTIDDSIRRSAADRVEEALSLGDLTDAEQAALVYEETSGADPATVAKWSDRMWKIVDEQDRRTRAARTKGLTVTVWQLRRRYPLMKHMDKRAFFRWVAWQGTVDGTPMLSAAKLSGGKLELSVRRADLRVAALNINRFAIINDGMVAWCGCDARTDVAVAETHFPLYVLRLDSATHRSQVFILPRR